MARRKNKCLNQFKAELAQGLKSLRAAQDGIRNMQETSGGSDAEIRTTMLRCGFGRTTADQFLAAKTMEDVIRLLEPGTRGDLN